MKIYRNKVVIGLALACLTTGEIFWGVGGNCYAAIVNPKAPDGGRQIVIENVGRNLQAQPDLLGGLRLEDLTIAEPHREYFVGLTNLAAGHLLSAAKPGGWRYLLIHGTNAVGAATLIAVENTGKVLGFNSLQEPFFPNAPRDAVRMAEQLPKIRKQNYELRYLGIPGVNFVAVWLHWESDDILIPLPPAFGRFNTNQPYSESEILKVLKQDAESVVKFDERLKQEQVDTVWKAVWESGNQGIKKPKIEKLSEGDVVQRMPGTWTVMFGVIPDKLTISLSTNRLVEVSGWKDGAAWKKSGQWRVISDKLVLFLKEDNLPNFIFMTGQHTYIFDPWAKTMMSELSQEK